MQNQHPSIEDLLKDESFSNYCRGENEQDIRTWQNYLAQNPGKKELIEEAVRQYRLLFNTIADLDLREQLEILRHKIENNEVAAVYSMNERSSHRGVVFYVRKFRIAAAVLLVIAGWVLFHPKQVPPPGKTEAKYVSKPGEKKIFQLPDGTQVTMNAGSEITLNNSYGQDTREVFLKGEAFFDVHQNKNAPFIVHTPNMDIRALGTAFNVRSYVDDKIAQTALIRGLVEITLKKENNKKILLHPNEKVSWRQAAETEDKKPASSSTPAIKEPPVPEQIVISPVKKMDDGTAQELAWASNNLVFDDESFDEIVPRLERWYGVKMVFGSEDIKMYRFTATFRKEKIERVLDILKTSKEFNYHFDSGQTIIIYK